MTRITKFIKNKRTSKLYYKKVEKGFDTMKKEAKTKNLKTHSSNKKEGGVCLGLADGKVVVKSKSINEVMNTLIQNYPDSKISITSVPRGDKIFIL